MHRTAVISSYDEASNIISLLNRILAQQDGIERQRSMNPPPVRSTPR